MKPAPDTAETRGSPLLCRPLLLALSLLTIGVIASLVVGGFALHSARARSRARELDYRQAGIRSQEDFDEACNEWIGRLMIVTGEYRLRNGGCWSGGSSSRLRSTWIDVEWVMNEDLRVVAAIALYQSLDATGSSPRQSRETFVWSPDPSFDSFVEQIRPDLERWGRFQRIDSGTVEDLQERLSTQSKQFLSAP